MKQSEFSNIVLKELLKKYPSFSNEIKWENEEVFIAKSYNPSKNLSLWIDTSNMEIMIGLNDKKDRNTWHEHIDNRYGSEIKDKLEIALELIDSIIGNKEIIVYSSILGYFIPDNDDSDEKYKYEDEVIEYKYWNEY